MVAKTAYGASAHEIAELFGDFLQGGADRPALALSGNELTADARNAIEKSLESFGYAAPNCSFATLIPSGKTTASGDFALDPHALFLMVEGLDPLFLIAADVEATHALGEAYRMQLHPDAGTRVFGRNTAAFTNLADLMRSDRGKQAAWRVLKTLNS